ncbi:MAG: hypothetical protein J5846_10840 [Desulfovibrio sp.]|nr:hypothetical protein [Desulfovibrio sp.]
MPNRCLAVLSLLLVLCSTVLVTACEKEKPKIMLFEQYYYGMPFKDVQTLSKATYCQDTFDSLCRPNPVTFFRESWYQRFLFKRERLVAVQLINRKPEQARKLIDTWLDTGFRFMPVSITSGGKQLDLFAAIKSTGKEGARKAVYNFTRATAADLEMVYLYLDLQGKENALNSFGNLSSIFNKGPRDLVGIEERVNDKEIVVSFIAPIADWQDRGSPR